MRELHILLSNVTLYIRLLSVCYIILYSNFITRTILSYKILIEVLVLLK